MQVYKVYKSKCMHLPCEQYTMLSVLQLQSWSIPKFLELILFILLFMLGLFDYMNYCFWIKILLKDISVSLSSLSSIPTSKTCNFFQRHFYTLRLKFLLISINFAIEWYIIWLHLRNFTNSRILRPNERFLTKWPHPIKGKYFFLKLYK